MRFKKELLTAFVGMSVPLFAGLANAAPIEHLITFGTTVPTSCTISGPTSVVNGPFTDAGQLASTFTVPVAGTTANATSGEITIGTVNCTSNSIKVTMTTNGWIKNLSDSNKVIEYSANIVNNGTPITSTGSFISSAMGNGEKNAIISAQSSTVGVRIATRQAADLSAGIYSGTLKISINPN